MLRMAGIKALVLGLGRVKTAQGREFGHDRCPEGIGHLQFVDQRLRKLRLLGRVQ